MNVSRVIARQFVAQLPDRLEERQTFDVADRAADLAQDEIEALVAISNEVLDGVGDVRNDLNGGAEIIAATLLRQDFLVNPPGGDVVGPGGGTPGKTLVMAEIEIGLGAIVGDEHLAVLVRRHRARIDVEIGVELAQANLVAARLQQRAQRCGGETLAQRGNHAAGDEDVPRHGTQRLVAIARFDERYSGMSAAHYHPIRTSPRCQTVTAMRSRGIERLVAAPRRRYRMAPDRRAIQLAYCD